MIENLGNKLKAMRVLNNLSRKQVAERIVTSVSAIGLYESGERQPPLDTFIKLATIYKVSADYLLGIEDNNQDSISTKGLTYKQIKALKLTVECFHNANT